MRERALDALALVFAALGLVVAASFFAGALDSRLFWRTVSLLGSMEFYVAVLPVVYHSLGRLEAVGLSFSLLLAGTAVGVAKDFFKMPRPPGALEEGYGFPSGHAAGSTAFWGYLALQRPSSPLLLVSLTVVGLVSLSRLALGEHYPVDVAGGVALGALAAASTTLAAQRLGLRYMLGLSLAVGATGLALFLAGYGVLEPPAVLLGFALGELALNRLLGRGAEARAGPLLGALGSLSAAIAVALARLSDHLALEVLLFAAAGALAVVVPKIVKARLDSGKRAES
ncbi:MAG: phosphatase PAP2 family protein [Acidilobaceae archaeon]